MVVVTHVSSKFTISPANVKKIEMLLKAHVDEQKAKANERLPALKNIDYQKALKKELSVIELAELLKTHRMGSDKRNELTKILGDMMVRTN